MMTMPLQRLWCVYHGIIFLPLPILFASPTCTLALFYACKWELLCNKRVSAEPFLKGPQWVDNSPRGERMLLWRLKWGGPARSLYCAHFSSPSAPHFLLRPFSPGSRSCCLNLSSFCSHSFSLCLCYQAFPFMVQLFLIFFSHLFLSAPFLLFFFLLFHQSSSLQLYCRSYFLSFYPSSFLLAC